MKKLIYWLPRILTIIYILFLSLFAFDAFDNQQNFWQTTLALLIHLVPNFILIVILILSWRREWIGGILFIFLGLVYIFWAWGRFPFVTYLAIAGPLFLTGIFFLIGWFQRKNRQ